MDGAKKRRWFRAARAPSSCSLVDLGPAARRLEIRGWLSPLISPFAVAYAALFLLFHILAVYFVLAIAITGAPSFIAANYAHLPEIWDVAKSQKFASMLFVFIAPYYVFVTSRFRLRATLLMVAGLVLVVLAADFYDIDRNWLGGFYGAKLKKDAVSYFDLIAVFAAFALTVAIAAYLFLSSLADIFASRKTFIASADSPTPRPFDFFLRMCGLPPAARTIGFRPDALIALILSRLAAAVPMVVLLLVAGQIYSETFAVNANPFSVSVSPVLLAVAFLMFVLQIPLERYARWRLNTPHAAPARSSARRPILFLRSFSDTHVDLKPVRFELFRNVDMMLRFRFRQYGPIIAAGLKSEPVDGFSVPRVSLEGDDWLPHVSRNADEAQMIVLVVHKTAGIQSELEYVLNGACRWKTVFLLHRSLDDNEISSLIARLGISPGFAVARLVGFIFGKDGKPVLFIGDRSRVSSVEACLRLGFYAILGPPEGSVSEGPISL